MRELGLDAPTVGLIVPAVLVRRVRIHDFTFLFFLLHVLDTVHFLDLGRLTIVGRQVVTLDSHI